MNSDSLVKFHGNALCVSHDDSSYKVAIQELIKIATELKKTNSSNNWESTQNGLRDLVQRVADPNSQIQRYQVDLLNEVLIPYLKKQKGRYYTDAARVRQMNEIVYALSLSQQQHPAICLNILERVKTEISQNQSYLWKSELLTVLETAVAKQWLPIVNDTRQFLIGVSGKLFVIGMVGVVGWPMALLSPMVYSAQKLLKAMEEWERRKQLSNETILECVKILVMVIVLMQLLSVLQVYAGMGRLCVALSVAGYLVAQSDDLVKSVAPVLAPHALVIDQVFTSLSQGDLATVMKTLAKTTQSISSSSSAATSFPSSTRVQVLEEEEEEDDQARDRARVTTRDAAIPVAMPVTGTAATDEDHVLSAAHYENTTTAATTTTSENSNKKEEADVGLRKRRYHVRP